jgi:hypothetical protein
MLTFRLAGTTEETGFTTTNPTIVKPNNQPTQAPHLPPPRRAAPAALSC